MLFRSSLLRQLNTLESNAEANLNLQKKNLEQTLTLAKDTVKLEIKSFEESEVEGISKVQKYQEAIKELDENLAENIRAFKEFKNGNTEGDEQ